MSKKLNAREIVLDSPNRFIPNAVAGWNSIIHMNIKGERGGEFTLKIQDQNVTVKEGFYGFPKLVLEGNADVYEAIEYNELNPQMAFFMGKIRVSDMNEMNNVAQAFKRVYQM